MAGRRPSELLPPIENEVQALDFDVAVALHLQLFEQRAEAERMRDLSRMIGAEVARLLLPAWGYELKQAGPSQSGCASHTFIDGQCRACGLRNEGGVLRYGPDPIECDAHEIENGFCRKCGGREIREGWVTRPTPRVLGRCEHPRHEPNPGGGLRCLDCGEVGY